MKKILFIGNSFTYFTTKPGLTMPNIFGTLNPDFSVSSITAGGWSLTQFANSSDEQGKLVYEALESDTKYDYVVLQEQSHTPITNYGNFFNSSEVLCNLIRKNNPDAEIIFYSTWGYKKTPTCLAHVGVEEMTDLIAKSYTAVADYNKAKVIYVGDLFLKITSRGVTVMHTDNHHQSYNGAFLTALAFTKFINPELKKEDIKYKAETEDNDFNEMLDLVF